MSGWGALIGAAASLYAGNRASKDARRAGDQAAAGSEQSTALQRDMWQTGLGLMRPQYDASNWALGMLTGAVGGPSNWGSGYANMPTGGQDWVVEGADGMPAPNSQLYHSDPQYRQAWDAALQQHRNQWKGKGYHAGSDNEWIRSQIGQRYSPQTGGNQPPSQAAAPMDRSKLFEMFRSNPGYQFGLDEGRKTVEAGAAAAGGLNSGKTLKALTKYGQDYADAKGWQPYLGTLKDIAGLNNSTQIASMGQNFGQQVGQNYQNAANARANSTYASGQARQQGYADAWGYMNKYGSGQGWW